MIINFQVPYELLNKKFRAAQKSLDREVSHVQAAAQELERGLAADTVGAGDISRILGGMVEKLQVLKRKVITDSILLKSIFSLSYSDSVEMKNSTFN